MTAGNPTDHPTIPPYSLGQKLQETQVSVTPELCVIFLEYLSISIKLESLLGRGAFPSPKFPLRTPQILGTEDSTSPIPISGTW